MQITKLFSACALALGAVTGASAYTHPVYFYNYTEQPITVKANNAASKDITSYSNYNTVTVQPFSVDSISVHDDLKLYYIGHRNYFWSTPHAVFEVNDLITKGFIDIYLNKVDRYDKATTKYKSSLSDFSGINALIYMNWQRAASEGWSQGDVDTGNPNQDFLVFVRHDKNPGHYNWPYCPSVTGLNNPQDSQENDLDFGKYTNHYACYFNGDAMGDQPRYKVSNLGGDPETATGGGYDPSGNPKPVTYSNVLYRITFLGGSYWMGPYANTEFTYWIGKDKHYVYPNNGYTSYRWAGNAPLTDEEGSPRGISYNMGDSDGFAKIFYTPNTFSWVVSLPKDQTNVMVTLGNTNFDAYNHLSHIPLQNYDSNTMQYEQDVNTTVALPKPQVSDKTNVKSIAFDANSYDSFGNGIEARAIGIKLTDTNDKAIDPSSDAYKHIVFYYHYDNNKPTDLVDNDLVSTEKGVDANLALITESDMSNRLSYFYSIDANDPIEQIAKKLTQYLSLPLYYDPKELNTGDDYKKFYLYSYNPNNSSQGSVTHLEACYISGDTSICTGDTATININLSSFSEQATTNPFKCDTNYDCEGIGITDPSHQFSNMAIPNTPSYAFNKNNENVWMMSAVIDTQYNPDYSSTSTRFIDGVNYNPNIFVHHDLPLFIKLKSGDDTVFKDQLLDGGYDHEKSSHASYNRTVFEYDEPVVGEDNNKHVEVGFIANVYGYNNRI